MGITQIRPPTSLTPKAFRFRVLVLVTANLVISGTSFYVFWKASLRGDLEVILISLLCAIAAQGSCAFYFCRFSQQRLSDLLTNYSLNKCILVIGAMLCPLSGFFYLWTLMVAERGQMNRFQNILLKTSTCVTFAAMAWLTMPFFGVTYMFMSPSQHEKWGPAYSLAPKIFSVPTCQYIGDLAVGVTSLMALKDQLAVRYPESKTILKNQNFDRMMTDIQSEFEKYTEKNHVGVTQGIVMQSILVMRIMNQRKHLPSSPQIRFSLDFLRRNVDLLELMEKRQNVFEVFSPFSAQVLTGAVDLGIIVAVDELVKIKYYTLIVKILEKQLAEQLQFAEKSAEADRGIFSKEINALQERLGRTVAAKYQRSYESAQSSKTVLGLVIQKILPEGAARSVAATSIEGQ